MKTNITNRFLAKTGIAIAVFAVSISTVFGYQIETIDVANLINKDFVVGPGKVEVEIKPGEQRVINLKVSNRMGDTRIFKVDIEDFTGSKNPQETVVLLGSERGPYSLKDYLKVPEMTFELKDGERATVPVTVSVPTDAEPGGRYGSILITTTSKNSEAGAGGSAIISRIGTLFFVTVPGEVKSEGKLIGFETVGAKRFFSKGPIDFRLLYENKGSVHVNPYGQLKVNNILGEEVGVVNIDPWFAMPDSLRLREVSWNRPFLFGLYTVTASINRGYNDEIDTQSLSFWVLPWNIMIAVFVGLVVLVFVLRFVLTRFEIRKK